MLVLNLPAFENKKYTAYDRFQGNGPYGEIPTKKEPIRTLGFALPYNKVNYPVVSFKFLITSWEISLDVSLSSPAISSFVFGDHFKLVLDFVVQIAEVIL